jgi:hypothetical protein
MPNRFMSLQRVGRLMLSSAAEAAILLAWRTEFKDLDSQAARHEATRKEIVAK